MSEEQAWLDQATQERRAHKARERVRADVLRTTGKSVDILAVRDNPGSRLRITCDGEFSHHDSGGLFSIGAELVAQEVAETIQDVLMDRWGKPWPECLEHGRVYDPRLREGRAVWVCPRGHESVVGELGNGLPRVERAPSDS